MNDITFVLLCVISLLLFAMLVCLYRDLIEIRQLVAELREAIDNCDDDDENS